MNPTFIKHEFLQTEYLANMQNGDALKVACATAVEHASGTELLDLRVELILLTLRLRDLEIAPHLYAFLPTLLGELQLKVTAEKLKDPSVTGLCLPQDKVNLP